MKASRYLFLLTIFLSFSLSAIECDLKSPLKVFHPQYATHYWIEYFKNFKVLHVDNDKYLLSDMPEPGCEISMIKISTPVKKTVMMSTTYLPALELIHQEKSLIGFQGKRYIVSTAFNLNQIKEVAFKFNPEDLLLLKADLIMGYDSNLTNSKQHQIFNSLKIPVVLNKDFEEKSPLGRAEWLVFISSFYNQDDKAIEIFNSIKKNYLEQKEKNLKLSKKTKVIVGEIQNGYWMSCDEQSDLAQLIKDAGGELGPKHVKAKTQKISLEELSLDKSVFDVWLTNNLWTSRKDLEEALRKESRYSLITAKNIYNNNLIMNINKSNDYWETGMQRPDLLLRDLTTIFHPEDYKNQKLNWYRKL